MGASVGASMGHFAPASYRESLVHHRENWSALSHAVSQPPSLGLPTSSGGLGPYKVLPSWQVEFQGTPRVISGLAPLPQSMPQDWGPAGQHIPFHNAYIPWSQSEVGSGGGGGGSRQHLVILHPEAT